VFVILKVYSLLDVLLKEISSFFSRSLILLHLSYNRRLAVPRMLYNIFFFFSSLDSENTYL